MSEQTLTLDVSGKDRAAMSILYAYLHARGVDMAGGEKAHVLKVAQFLANNPDEDAGTCCQSWENFERWPGVIANHTGRPAQDCTLRDASICAGSTGFEVAAVILRRIDDDERQWNVEQVRDRFNELHETQKDQASIA